MGREQAKQAGAFGQVREPVPVVVGEPAIEAARPDTLEREEQPEGDEFARIEVGVGMFGQVAYDAIDSDEQVDDKILGRQANLLA
jgi:hypothetical protein